MKILMLYASDLFDSDIEEKSIAGTQTAFIELSRAFEKLGNTVSVYTDSLRVLETEGRIWKHLSQVNVNIEYDLMIVNVSPYLLENFKNVKTGKKILWIHNVAKYLLYWNRLNYLLKYLPIVVFSGKYHKSTLPFFIPTGGRKLIEYGLSEAVFQSKAVEAQSRNQKVYFTSNPLRSLRWIVDLWVKEIHPKVPTAELHVFSGWKTYGSWGLSVKKRMQAEVDYAALFVMNNILIRDVLPKQELFSEMKQGRAMFYKGDRSETFCLAVAEAQALGLPAVVCDLGSMKERVDHGVTGFVARSDDEFVKYAIKVLQEEQLCEQLSIAAKKKYSELNWIKAANQFLDI
jgi:glycosyltransferase involved in cell wall biosynthesis